MGFSLSYKALFEIFITHHFWMDKGGTVFHSLHPDTSAQILRHYDVSKYIKVEPDEPTQQKIKGLHLLFKPTETGFQVLTRVSKSDKEKTFHEFDASGEKFTFNIYLEDDRFYNYTALPFPESKDDIFYFSNRQPETHFPALSKPPPVFEGEDYRPGDIVLHDDTLYMAVAETNTPPPDNNWVPDINVPDYDNNITYTTGDVIQKDSDIYMADDDDPDEAPGAGGQWLRLYEVPHHCAHQQCKIRLAPAVIQINNPLEDTKVVFSLINEEEEVIINEILDPEGDKNYYILRTGEFAPGVYTLNIKREDNDEEISTSTQYFTIHPVKKRLTGVIEIFSHPEAGLYNLFGGSDNMQSPVYEIRFKNRYTNWLYKHNKTTTQLHDAGLHPLTSHGMVDINFEDTLLPNPGADMIKPAAGSYYISEVFIDEPQKND